MIQKATNETFSLWTVVIYSGSIAFCMKKLRDTAARFCENSGITAHYSLFFIMEACSQDNFHLTVRNLLLLRFLKQRTTLMETSRLLLIGGPVQRVS